MKYLLVAVPLLLVSCGYHFAETDTALPKTIHTVCIPAFNNLSTRYKLTDQLPEAIAREFLTRTRYRVVSDPNTADAVLRGTVINYAFNPTIFDQATGRAVLGEIRVTLAVTLTEQATGESAAQPRPNFDVRRATYQIEPECRFSTSRKAIRHFEARGTQQVARSIVSAVLENF